MNIEGFKLEIAKSITQIFKVVMMIKSSITKRKIQLGEQKIFLAIKKTENLTV